MILKISIGAFVRNEATAKALEEVRGDRLFLRSTITVNEGGMDTAIAYLSQNDTPDLLVVETATQGQDPLFEELGKLADVCAPNTRLILIGQQNDVSLYKTLIDQGVSEYLVNEATANDIRGAATRIFSGDDTEGQSRTIAVTSTRGGAGSSMVAQNIAWELANQFNDDVVLVDLDIAYGTSALAFNVQPRQTIVDALSQTSRLDEVIVERFRIDLSKKLSLLASPASLAIGTNVSPEAFEAVHKILRRMASFVVLDLPHSWQPWVSEILVDADETVLVAQPDLVNLRDAKAIFDVLGPKRGVDAPLRLVLNRMGEYKKSELSVKDFKETVGTAPNVVIPYDANVFGTAMNNGEMVSKVSAKSKPAEALRKLARNVSGTLDEKPTGKRSLAGLFKKS